MTSFSFKGAAVAAVTPFTQSGQIDKPLLRDLIEWWIAEGIEGLVLCGSTGEMAYLDPEERLRIFATGVSVCNGRIPVIAGTGFPNTADTIAVTKAAERLGVDAALVLTPYYYKISDEAMTAHFEAVASQTSLPVFLYNMPPLTNVNLSVETISQLSKIDNVVGIKDSAGDFEQLQQIIEKTDDDFCVLTGSFPLLSKAVEAGADGAILAMANLIPEACVTMRRLAAEGKMKEAQDLYGEFEYLQDWLKAHGIPGIKQKLAEWHHPAGWPRKPLQPLKLS